MFGWFKSKQVDPKEIYHKIASGFQALEGGLKGVENHWLAGNTAEGDQLFAAIYKASLRVFLEGPKDRPDDIRLLQFEGLKRLSRFLERHSRHDELRALMLKLSDHINDFDPEQKGYFVHMMDIAMEKRQDKSKVTNTKLVYYTCQGCGQVMLTVTEPCLYCGFSCRDEIAIRRGLLLGSQVLNPSVLLHVSRALLASRNSSAPRTIHQVWGAGNIDDAARKASHEFDPIVSGLLEKSLSKATTFAGPPNINIRCPQCGNASPIFTDRLVQSCPNCKAVVPVPTQRRIKAALARLSHFPVDNL